MPRLEPYPPPGTPNPALGNVVIDKGTGAPWEHNIEAAQKHIADLQKEIKALEDEILECPCESYHAPNRKEG